MPTYRVNPSRSQIWMEADSNVHPIHGEADGLQGEIVAEVVDGRLDLSLIPKMRLELPVDQLQSGNAMQDKELRRRIDARRHPTIVGEAREVSQQGNGTRYRVRGNLTFHGVTRPVEGEIDLSKPDERTLVIEGAQTFDIRDYGVDPPKILMFKVHPIVKVRVKVVGELQG
ncbi:MAG: YceI family protein [Egibacteraceae bacterium]